MNNVFEHREEEKVDPLYTMKELIVKLAKEMDCVDDLSDELQKEMSHIISQDINDT